MSKYFLRVIFPLTLLLLICGCGEEEIVPQKKIAAVDVNEIVKRGKIRAITGYNAYSYFIYRGRPMGFEYELMKKFADFLKVDLELIVVKDINKMFEKLNKGEGDIIAFNLTVTNERRKKVDFTYALNTTRQVLVQRKNGAVANSSNGFDENGVIRNPIYLSGKSVWVRAGSVFESRLENLSEEIGGEINIIEAPDELSMEDLIEMVAEEDIDYTIADENVALLNAAYYHNIDVETKISFPQRIAWAVRKNSFFLKGMINGWIKRFVKTYSYKNIYNKYYKNRLAFRYRKGSEYFAIKGNRISAWDETIKANAERIGWDWRLLAALIYTESHFHPDAESWAGAVGLMQIMPGTAVHLGIEDRTDPHQSIRAGSLYLKMLDDHWKKYVPDFDERVKFVMASYNVGRGHVDDAFRLARKYDADTTKWEGSVQNFLKLKSDRKYYNDPVVRFGYCRCREPLVYVKAILELYEHYKKFIK